MKKFFGLFLLSAALTVTAGCSMGNIDRSRVISAPRDYELTVIALGDTNGQAEGGQGKGIGYSRFSTVLERARKEFGKENVLYLDAGNAFYGSPMAEADRGESMVKILNALGLDAAVLGNNDFNYGEKNIKALEMRANFKFLSANVKDMESGQNFAAPYIIKEIRGTKVGIFGLTSPETYDNEKAQLDTLTIDEPILSASKTVKELKSQGAEFIILVSHLGMNENTNKEWQSTAIAENVQGIDLIIDGNCAEPLEDKLVINDTAIIQTGENLMNIGVLKIDFDAPKRDEERIFYKLIKKEDIVMVDDIPVQTKPQETNPQKFVTHTVVKGDTLYSLAKRYNTTVENIVALNPSIEDGKTISIGQTYIMTSDKKPQTVKTSDLSEKGFILHTVVKGDTLYSLSKKYGTTVDAVAAANPEITDGQSIKIGHTYKFPSSVSEVSKEDTAVQEVNTEEDTAGNFPEENTNVRVAASSGIAKDPKIEELIAKIKSAQSFIIK